MSASLPEEDDDLAQRLRASRRLLDAPEDLIQRAIGLWPAVAVTAATAAGPAQAAGPLRRLLASLRFDSAHSDPLALGLRSSAHDTRQLLFFSEGRDIDIRLIPSHGVGGVHWRLAGQVLGPDAHGVALLKRGGEFERAEWNELSEFTFSDIGAGACVVVLRGTDWEIELPSIDVPA
jgi:hypothetical protein